jgi:TPR repeat protein
MSKLSRRDRLQKKLVMRGGRELAIEAARQPIMKDMIEGKKSLADLDLNHVQLFEEAAKRGDLNSALVAAKFYMGEGGAPKNLEKAEEFYRIAANKGHATAKAHLGVALYEQVSSEKLCRPGTRQ